MNSILTWLFGVDSADLAGGHWRLGFLAEYGNYVRLGLFALLSLLVVLTIRSYRREGSARTWVKHALAGLRVAVLVLVVVLLFQPAVIVRFVRMLHTSVLVLVDDSMSMGYADRYAALETERQGLAEVIGVDENQLAELSRREIAVKLLTDSELIDSLRADHPVELLRFSTDRPGQEAYTEVLASLAVRDGGGGADVAAREALAGLESKGYQTDLARALRDALDRYRGRRIGAVVLLSDGQPTRPEASERLAEAAEYLRERNVPLYALRVGDPTPPENLAVTAVRCPREIRAKSKTDVTVLLSHWNMAGREVAVRLYRRGLDADWPDDLAGTEPVASKRVKLAGEDAETGGRGMSTVTLTITPPGEGLGEYVYRAVVDKAPNERTGEDNAAEAFVKISDSKIRILLVSADAGWEFRFLRNYFLRQPELYRVSVWQQNADTEVNQSASSGMKLNRLPRSLKELIDTGPAVAAPATPAATQPTTQREPNPTGYHVVMLYDPSPTQDGFDETFIENLYRFVAFHRGGLCYMTSNRNTVDVLRDPAAEKLADLLPVTVARNPLDVSRIYRQTRPRAWSVRLSSYGLDHPITQLEPETQSNKAVWSVLPGIYWSQSVARTKPAARVLLEHGDSTRTTRLPSQIEPLLVAQAVGNGRVVYVGFDETWRWRYVEDGYYYRRFWGNVVRYLAPLHARQVVISTGGERFSAGEEITVDVEAYDEDYQPLEADELTLTVTDTRSGEVAEHVLQAVKGKPGRFRGAVLADRTGTFAFSVPASVADPRQVASRQIVVTLPQAEAKRTEANPQMLTLAVAGQGRAVAAEGGEPTERYLFAAYEIDQLTEALRGGASRPEQAVEEVRHTLWDTPGAWLMLVGLLAVEWFLRKRANMA